MTRPLRTIKQAAKELQVPEQALRDSAKSHGLLIRMGSAIRLDPQDYGELIARCQENPRDHASTGGKNALTGDRDNGSSETDGSNGQQAQTISSKLKTASKNTSPQSAVAQVVRLKT